MFPVPDNTRSPLEAISYGRFNGPTYLQTTQVSVSTTFAQILRNNPNRVFWLMSNGDANDVRLELGPTIPTAAGLLLAAKGGVVSMNVQDDGEAVGYEVWGLTVVATAGIYVVEVIRE